MKGFTSKVHIFGSLVIAASMLPLSLPASAGEVLTDRRSQQVAFVPSHGDRPEKPGKIILERNQNGSTSWTASFKVQTGNSSLHAPLQSSGVLIGASSSALINATPSKVDFNGDGKADLLWRNYKTGDISAWLMNGANAPTYPPVYANVPAFSEWHIEGLGDFNGDGRTDVFWRNYKTGDTSAWLTNGANAPTYTPSLGNVSSSSGWSIQGFGDFNGDGKADVFWYNSKTGDTSAWLMNGANTPTYTVYGNVPSLSGWRIEGFGDFNGDGKADVFWYNSKTGDTSAWLMNGANTPTYTLYGNVPSLSGWRIEGFGDFNSDGKTDAFWRNHNTGDTSAWLMNGANAPTYTPSLGNVSSSSGWSIQGFGDFNGDSKADVFWYNSKTGDTSAWLMNGANTPTYTVYGNVPSLSGWRIKGFGDFNSDGKTDVFWYNANLYRIGETSAWLMNGANAPTYTPSLGNVPPSSGWETLFANQKTGKISEPVPIL